MNVEHDSLKRFRARIQRSPSRHLLGAAVFLPAEVIEPFICDTAEEIEYTLKAHPDGILIKSGGNRV